jgi:hypothetical protein
MCVGALAIPIELGRLLLRDFRGKAGFRGKLEGLSSLMADNPSKRVICSILHFRLSHVATGTTGQSLALRGVMP